MKNLIDPQILAAYKENPPTTKEIVDYLDNNDNISTAQFCKLLGILPRRVYDYRHRNQKNSIGTVLRINML